MDRLTTDVDRPSLVRAWRRATSEVGGFLIDTWARLALTVAVLLSVAWHASRPQTWRRTVRRELVRQCWRVGVSALPASVVVAAIVGVALVFQAMYWLSVAGEALSVNEIVFGTLIRELSPLLVAFIVIGRSITVMLVELAHMRSNGQIRLLDAQGIDSFDYLVVPRIAALAVCTLSLGLIFVAASLVTAYLAARTAGITELSMFEFTADVAGGLDIDDFVLFPCKSLALGAVVGATTCVTALASPGEPPDVTQVLPRGYMRAVLATFIVSAALSWLILA